MKILINGYYNFLPKSAATFSGPRNLLGNFLEHLDQTPHNYTAMVMRGKKINDAKFTLRRIRTKKDSSWLVIKLRLNTAEVFDAKKPGLPKSLQQPLGIITELVKKEKPDIMFINGMSITNWYLLKAAQKLKIPVIVNHLGLWFKEIPEYGGSPSGIKIMREMEKDMIRLSAKNIFLSKLSMRHLDEQLIKVPLNKRVFIPNPVDPVFFSQPKPQPKGKILKIGIVGRWDPIKNHRAVLDLALEAKKQNLPVEFHAVTTIHKKYKWGRDIKQAYKKNVVIHGPMKPIELKKFYSSMNILILPSHFDVSPTVVMEALMQNRMTVISENVGLVDPYRDYGAKNYIIDFKNTKQALKQIVSLAKLTPPKKLVEFVRKNYNPESVMERYMKLIESIVKA